MPSLNPQDLVLLGVIALAAAFFLWRRFGPGNQALPVAQLLELKRKGALVLDVRTPAEFAAGHAKGAKNLPLATLPAKLGDLKPGQVILTCCASGARSAAARNLLLKAGFTEVHNAGPWQTLKD
jgi:rhodanese-related sulfurtransferase